jgi:hypothetical protein
MWGASFLTAFLAAAAWCYSLTIEPSSPSAATFLGLLALIFATGAVVEFREALRCYDLHHYLYEIPSSRRK